jgi:ATP/maltotriose-dependent transcriptional regulator MalT
LLERCREPDEPSGGQLPSTAYMDGLLDDRRREGGDSSPDAPGFTTQIDGFPVSLSAREMQVLSLIAEGRSNQEIGEELYLALNTVKRHVYNIFAKLEVKKRAHAVIQARRLGLIP